MRGPESSNQGGKGSSLLLSPPPLVVGQGADFVRMRDEIETVFREVLTRAVAGRAGSRRAAVAVAAAGSSLEEGPAGPLEEAGVLVVSIDTISSSSSSVVAPAGVMGSSPVPVRGESDLLGPWLGTRRRGVGNLLGRSVAVARRAREEVGGIWLESSRAAGGRTRAAGG